MHGGAVTLARRWWENGRSPHIFLATDMLDLTTFLALTRPATAHIPVVLYMHENQLTYPLPADKSRGGMRRQHGERDYHYAFINLVSMLAADAVAFNSHYHLNSWLAALPSFLKHFPEYKELNAIARIQNKSVVLPVGVEFARFDPAPTSVPQEPPLILWNQRWEYDKNSKAFFAALTAVAQAGLPFRLALCGQQYGKQPAVFTQALETFADQIIHCGLADAAAYRQLLWQADIVISTAHHEFFGISILEAIYCHTFPLLPQRLSYPELLPPAYHDHCLYTDQADLVKKLTTLLKQPHFMREKAARLATAVSTYHWSNMAPAYDALLKTIYQDAREKQQPLGKWGAI